MAQLRAPEPGSFEHLLRLVPVPIANMVRLSVSGATEPFWSRHARYRFDDPSPVPPAARFGVLYVATRLDTAFAESVIHEHMYFRQGRYQVPAADIDRRELISYAHATQVELQLVDLTGAALKRMALSSDLCAGDDYTRPQQWAKAIHDACLEADGLLYPSRQNPGQVCCAIFERSQLQVAGWSPLTDAQKLALCDRFNVDPV